MGDGISNIFSMIKHRGQIFVPPGIVNKKFINFKFSKRFGACIFKYFENSFEKKFLRQKAILSTLLEAYRVLFIAV